jgi:hypothetical protein
MTTSFAPLPAISGANAWIRSSVHAVPLGSVPICNAATVTVDVSTASTPSRLDSVILRLTAEADSDDVSAFRTRVILRPQPKHLRAKRLLNAIQVTVQGGVAGNSSLRQQ